MKEGAYSKVTIPPVKDFVSKGIIFVESKVTIDVNREKTGSEITNEMLMREAEKLGADDVINVKIDKIEAHKMTDSYDKDGYFIKRKYKQYNYIYKATGLAIKYTKAIEYPVQNTTSLSNKKEEEKLKVENNRQEAKQKQNILEKKIKKKVQEEIEEEID